jgi:TonB family protein
MKKLTSVFALALATLHAPVAIGAEEEFVPPRFLSGHPPRLPPLTSAGGLVVVEARIAASGIVEEIILVDDAPPFTDALVKAMTLWRFEPATSDGKAVPSRVSVTALFRAPVLMGGAPPPPARVARPSGETPFPTSTTPPAFPPQALYEGVVMVEVEVDREGSVAEAILLSSPSGFDEVALEAARKFGFQPARREGVPLAAYAILVFGLPQPVTDPLIRR